MSSSDHRFQVDLSGLIDLLSHHLYSSPSVFIRELLQNGIDAVTARKRVDDTFDGGQITVELIQRDGTAPTLLMQDNGVGLTEDELHQFLATIGQSSKRGEIERPTDFIGQFGIGLLSGFMVTDEIVIITRSAKPGNHPTLEWRGKTDGSYQVKKIDSEISPGTQVYLTSKATQSLLFDSKQLISLLQYYGEYLPLEIRFVQGEKSQLIRTTPPWELDRSNYSDTQLRSICQRMFDSDFWDAIPLYSEDGGVRGVAFILAHPTHVSAKHPHRVYLKGMLVSETQQDLLPDWAFFARCVVDVETLRPNASRESLYQDYEFELAREELGNCIRRYLIDLSKNEPNRLQELIAIHHLALKALALEDDQCLALFSDWFPFETTTGTTTLGKFRVDNPVIRYVRSRDEFRQISQIATAQSFAVINAGYVYDTEILQKLEEVRPNISVEEFDVSTLSHQFAELEIAEREKIAEFERTADTILQRYKCVAEVAKFRPMDLPAFFVSDGNANYLRSMEQSRESADELWGGIIENFTRELPVSYTRLYLNYQNPLIQRLSSISNPALQKRAVEMLYLQALLLGHFPLQALEFQLLSSGILDLVNLAIDGSVGGDDE